MTDLDTVHLGQGLRGFPFGSRRSIVHDLLGEGVLRRDGDDGDMILVYDTLDLEFTFWIDHNDALGYISTERAEAKLFGESLIGRSVGGVKMFVTNILGASVTGEDGCVHEDGHVQTWFDVDAEGLTFWFRDNILYGLDWTCAWNGDVPAWPVDPKA